MPNKETHKFWSTQPVKNDGEGEVTEIKENNKQLQLPAGFTFETLTFDDLDSIYELLKDSYVEDLSQNFRLFYSKEMLKWQFQNLSHKSEYLLGVKKDNKLYGFTFAKEHLMNINGHEVRMVSINFLCVVRMLRNRRLAPLIIREITRRAVSHGIQQAVFTGGIELPFMYSQAPYYHRMINMQKLIKLEYCGENSRTNQMKFDDWKLREGTREMEERDYKQVMDLYNKKCKGYSIYEILDEKEFAYQFTMRKDLLYTLVYEENGEIKEYGSFFLLDTLCTNNQAIIKTAYIYYHYSSDDNDMIKDLLAYAKSIGCDLLNALNVMDNHKFFDELDFEEGTGSLKYYLYNWNSPPVDSNQIHLVLP